MNSNNKTAVIIPAAGSGSRFGAEKNKIFLELAGKEIFLQTIELFSVREDVGQIIMAVSQADRDLLEADYTQQLKQNKVTVVTGGATRTESVRNALAKLNDDISLVAVHDAVRPCLTQQWIDEVFQSAAQTGAAILAWPLHGTIKRGDQSADIECTVDRENLYEAQTPQVFKRELIEQAYSTPNQATDDAEMVQQIGQKVKLVCCDPRNIKITRPADLIMAEAIKKSL